MAFDAGHSQAVVFGGRDPNGDYLGDTWTWSGGAVATTSPTITSVESLSGFGGLASAAPGSWVEIYGSNLAPDTGQWAGSDFSGNNAPTALDGVQVLIGGQNAFVEYVSPGQIDVQLPSNIPSGGSLPLKVMNGTVTSNPVNLTVNAVEPGLLAPASFQIGGKQYVVALFPDGTYVLPIGAISGVASRPAQPGDTITLYGIGFGAVTPATPAGQIAAGQTQLAERLQVLFGDNAGEITYAGLAPGFVGLYQFNVMVPNWLRATWFRSASRSTAPPPLRRSSLRLGSRQRGSGQWGRLDCSRARLFISPQPDVKIAVGIGRVWKIYADRLLQPGAGKRRG
jgi:uncharacterized protein (TIGR03437 family)